MMEKKQPLFFVLALLFFLSCLRPLLAVPLSRSLVLENQEPPVLLGEDKVVNREVRMMEEQFERMNTEINDYPGSGANSRHDPKSPGAA